MKKMPKAYNFKNVEEDLYMWWEGKGWFKPEVSPNDATPFVISIPPPNVTGELHMGHALFVALEDLMIRKARMQGFAALWVPGTDHAGIATQLQVEKRLMDEEGLKRTDIGRDAFLERTWAWKEKYGNYITRQLRKLGASCDWDRERFTLDEGLSVAVREAFVRLYRMGLIYQGEYLVNWSPGLQTAVSDLEVEYVEEPGFLYYFRYPVEGGGHLPVATTRPETILGDTAVAVHPDDERYRDYIGRYALVPMLNRRIPIIADSYVDVSFGTGALKVTPGHDHNDFEIGKRHELEIVNVLDKDASMSQEAGPYAGLDRFDCRQQLWADMENAGLAIRKEAYTLNVPRSQRGGEIIEPLISRQWFVNAEPIAKMALATVRSGRIRIVPERFVKVWENWLENIRPWCISRQLWWGHRIPVWYCQDCSEITVSSLDPDFCHSCGSSAIRQDPDVLDTWFSSALWPFSTLGWPEQTDDLARFYPTDVLETGYDILFFWVARMVMAGALFTNDIPFHTIYLHGLVRDEIGQKMSKTAGNVVDPLQVLSDYGTDALRFTLLTGGTPGNDLNLALAKVASNRNFANKIWNITRFVVYTVENDSQANEHISTNASNSPADDWIRYKLHNLVADVNRLFDSYQYGEAGRQIHDFLWNDLADWYIEVAKVQLKKDVLAVQNTVMILVESLDVCLRLLHPFMPFVTEAAWQELRRAVQSSGSGLFDSSNWSEALIIARWPEEIDAERFNVEPANNFERLRELVRSIRGVRAEYDVSPGRYISALVAAGEQAEFLSAQRATLATLARLDSTRLRIESELSPPDETITISLGDITAYLPLADMVDLDREKVRLTKELSDLDAQITRLSRLLAGEFREKAPPEVVTREREKLERYQASREEVADRLSLLSI